VPDLMAQGFFTGASTRNWESYGQDVVLKADLPTHAQVLMTDPQTSGGLLACVAPAAAERVLAAFRDAGFPLASVVGSMQARRDPRSMVRVI